MREENNLMLCHASLDKIRKEQECLLSSMNNKSKIVLSMFILNTEKKGIRKVQMYNHKMKKNKSNKIKSPNKTGETVMIILWVQKKTQKITYKNQKKKIKNVSKSSWLCSNWLKVKMKQLMITISMINLLDCLTLTNSKGSFNLMIIKKIWLKLFRKLRKKMKKRLSKMMIVLLENIIKQCIRKC